MTEAAIPTTARELVQRFGGRAVEFRHLPRNARKVIIKRANEHLYPDEKPPSIDPRKLFGYVEIPMEALKQALLAAVKLDGAPFETFDEYHQWYTGHGDTPNHQEVWPIELDVTDDDPLIDDGSHRFHSYVKSGLKVVPAIYSLDDLSHQW